MLNGNKLNRTHPLLVSGDAFAGTLFVRVLEDVVQPIRPRRNGPGRLPTPKTQRELLANRGFPKPVRELICAGEYPVPVEHIRQLLIDYYVAYPKRVSNKHADYCYLEAIADGTWVEVPALNGATVEHVKPKPQLVEKPQHPFFSVGDPDIGRRFQRVIAYYRSERKRLREFHRIGEVLLEKIAEGEHPVPEHVFSDIVSRVACRLAQNPLNVPPRAYEKLHEFAKEQNLLKG